MTYTAEQAHTDGRHVSKHPDDRAFWSKVCGPCASLATLRANAAALPTFTNPYRSTP